MSGASMFNIYKFSEVLGLISIKKVISKRDDFYNGATVATKYAVNELEILKRLM